MTSLTSSRPFLWLLLAAALVSFLLYHWHTQGTISRLTEQALLQQQHPSVLPSQPSPIQDGTEGPIVIYNRIPKTASTTLMHLPYELCNDLGYSVLLINNSRPQHYMTLKDSRTFALNITRWKERRPALYHGHFAYIDFPSLGVPSSPVTYINMVRRPLDRMVSYYYFLRYGDDFRANKIRSRMGDKVTFDECVERGMPDCDPRKLWLQIPWFCGHHKRCWDPGNRWALEQAKHNLVNKYFLVGLTEELESFVLLLEHTLPTFFSGAVNMYRNSGAAKHIRKTKHKDDPSEKTIKVLQSTKIFKLENEFYEFAESHFRWLKSELMVSQGETLFHYEKIRPLRNNEE